MPSFIRFCNVQCNAHQATDLIRTLITDRLLDRQVGLITPGPTTCDFVLAGKPNRIRAIMCYFDADFKMLATAARYDAGASLNQPQT